MVESEVNQSEGINNMGLIFLNHVGDILAFESGFSCELYGGIEITSVSQILLQLRSCVFLIVISS
jgi:hypothetical protein